MREIQTYEDMESELEVQLEAGVHLTPKEIAKLRSISTKEDLIKAMDTVRGLRNTYYEYFYLKNGYLPES